MDTDNAEHEVPRVAVVTPYYGPVSMGLINSIRLASKDPTLVRASFEAQASSSVLPHCFNQLLAVALDARDRGVVTHMAMCHADVLAEAGWLDALWGEMWLHNAAVISAVIPIKGPSGRTSTAVGDASDRWKIKRCLFVHDRKRLPVTFGPESVCQPGEVLLVNTGLMLCDLRHAFWDTFAFQFHCRLGRDAQGNREAQSRSEDWELSHDLHAAGLRYVATWKARLRHEGLNRWANYEEPA